MWQGQEHFHALILGSALNSNGRRSNGIAAPNDVAQAEVIKKAVSNAGVSSLGMTGTNAHIILEEAPMKLERIEIPCKELFILSARTLVSLECNTKKMIRFIKENTETLSFHDIAYTLCTGRRHLKYKLVLTANDTNELENDKIKNLFVFADQICCANASII